MRDSEQEISGFGDAVSLIISYIKQETLAPLKGIGRYLGFGLSASIFLAAGSLMALLAILRALQTETGTTFTGNWSWAPYFITLVVAAIIGGLASWAIGRTRRKLKKRAKKHG